MSDRPPDPESAPSPPESGKPDPDAKRQAGLALMIPTLLLAGPLVGLVMGHYLQKWFGWGNWIIFVMVLMGMAAGIRECIGVIQKISKP